MRIETIGKKMTDFDDIQEKANEIDWKIKVLRKNKEIEEDWIVELNNKTKVLKEMIKRYDTMGRNRIIVLDMLMEAFEKVSEFIEEKAEGMEEVEEFKVFLDSINGKEENKVKLI